MSSIVWRRCASCACVRSEVHRASFSVFAAAPALGAEFISRTLRKKCISVHSVLSSPSMRRPGPRGETGASRDELLWRLEDEDTSVRELSCSTAVCSCVLSPLRHLDVVYISGRRTGSSPPRATCSPCSCEVTGERACFATTCAGSVLAVLSAPDVDGIAAVHCCVLMHCSNSECEAQHQLVFLVVCRRGVTFSHCCCGSRDVAASHSQTAVAAAVRAIASYELCLTCSRRH